MRLSAEQRRTQLLDTAADLVVSRGFDALTMEAVSGQAGASKTLGYAYFANADDLILALWERELGRLYDRVVAASVGAATLVEKYAASQHAYWEHVTERGQLLGSLQAGIAARRLRPPRSARTDIFLRWLAEAIRAEYPVSARTAATIAQAAAAVPTVFSAALADGGARRRELEALSLEFGTAGLLAALEAAVGART